MRMAIRPETTYTKWGTWQLSVLATGFTHSGHFHPGSKLQHYQAKRPTERGRRSKSAEAVEDLNRGHRRVALGVGRLSHRRWVDASGVYPFGIRLKAL